MGLAHTSPGHWPVVRYIVTGTAAHIGPTNLLTPTKWSVGDNLSPPGINLTGGLFLGVGMGLNVKQKAFVEHFAGNAASAAEKAGYSKKTAKAQGSRLLTNADVLAAIREREKIESRTRIATRQARQEFWTDTMQDADAEMKDRLKASELLGKSEGDFLDRVQHSGNLETVVVIREGGAAADSAE